MLRLIDLRAGGPTPLGAALPRAAVDVSSAAHTVEPILQAVRTRGADAVMEFTEQLDGVRPASLRVPASALADAEQMLDPKVRAGLEESIRRARMVHQAQRPSDTPVQVVPGGIVTNRWLPVRRVGLYVPGGRAVYPSSVVMNVVPAQVAGVQSLAIASPAQPDFGGLPHPVILAAASLLGIDEVYAAGGAQAIGMFAYGIPDQVEPVDLITGPGNVYVVAAKRLVQGTVGIDAEAGPTEIAILADDAADPAYVAADLISQAEHDPLAAAVLVTDSERLIGEVDRRLSDLVAATKHVERITESLSGQQSGAVLVRDLEQALEVVEAYGAEHLQILTREPRVTAARVRNAGAVFVGPYSPVPLGDYCAGSNHVLPTGGTSRFSSGLSVLAFGRSMQVIEYDEAALAATAEHVTAMAYSEDLPAHAASVQVRAARAEDS